MYIQIVYASGHIKEFESPKAWIETSDNIFTSADGDCHLTNDHVIRISMNDHPFTKFGENHDESTTN